MKASMSMAIAAATFALMGASAANASTLLHFSFEPGSYFDNQGATNAAPVTGSFDFDPTTGLLSNVNYTSRFGHYFTGAEYTPGYSSEIYFGSFGTPNYDVFQLAGSLGNGGTVAIRSGTNPVRFISAGGSLTAGATGAVPEPATWAMMLFGFGGLGYTMRRNRNASARIRFA